MILLIVLTPQAAIFHEIFSRSDVSLGYEKMVVYKTVVFEPTYSSFCHVLVWRFSCI